MTTTQTTPSSLQTLSLAAIVESTFNPRKTFDAAKLQELADSIKAQGLLQPILVRPLPGSRVATTGRGITHEVVAGARRYRACQLAGLNEIMAVVCNLSDTAAMEAALIENLQRDDLSELEEAEGYAALCSMSNISKDELASKIHRSIRYIFNRLKLLKLQPLALTALRTGQIDATTALQIASVHDGDLQAKALKFATEPNYNGDKPSTRNLQTWMRNNVMLALNRAPFDINNITLRPSAGACTACPKRTGADPDLFADTTGPDSCCDAPCYHIKAAASRVQSIEKYSKQGIKVILADDEDYDDYDIDCYSPVSQIREDTTSGQPTTLLNLLGKNGQAEVGLIAIEHPQTKEIKVYVEGEKAEAWLLAQGLVKPDEPGDDGSSSAQSHNIAVDLKRLTANKAKRVEDAGIEAAQQAVQSLVLDLPGRLVTLHKFIEPDFIRAFLTCQVNPYSPGVLATALDVDPMQSNRSGDLLETLERVIAKAPDSVLIKAFTLVLLDQMRGNTDTEKAAELVADVESDLYASLCKPDADTLADINAMAQHDAAKDIEAQIAELEAKLNPPKTKPTQSPAGAAKSNARKDSKPAQPKPAKPPKLSATGFALGQRVTVTSDTDKLGMIAIKHAGKTGTITKREPGGGYWDVTFKGRNGGVSVFANDQLDATPA